MPDVREVVVIHPPGDSRHRVGERIPQHPSLPGLSPPVADFFVQLSGG